MTTEEIVRSNSHLFSAQQGSRFTPSQLFTQQCSTMLQFSPGRNISHRRIYVRKVLWTSSDHLQKQANFKLQASFQLWCMAPVSQKREINSELARAHRLQAHLSLGFQNSSDSAQVPLKMTETQRNLSPPFSNILKTVCH